MTMQELAGDGTATAAEPASVLVVVADPYLCDGAGEALQLQGFHVRDAHDTQAAVARLVERTPDCMVLDVTLPGGAAFELLELIEHRDLAPGTRVLALTDGEDGRALYRCFRLGVFKHLPKPVDPDLLVHCVRALLGMGHQEARRRRRTELDRARRQVADQEAATRRHFARCLDEAGWRAAEVVATTDPATGRLAYRLGDLCQLSVVDPAALDAGEAAVEELAALRTGAGVAVPLAMVSDGRRHLVRDERAAAWGRLFCLPTRPELVALRNDPAALVDGFVAAPTALRPYQRAAAHAVVRTVLDGKDKVLLQMACGSGKTATAAEVVATMDRVARERGERPVSALYLVQNDVLERQVVGRLRGHLRRLTVGTLERGGGADCDVLVAQVGTVLNHKHKAALRDRRFDLVVGDELFTSAPGAAWRTVMGWYPCPQLAMTAVPPGHAADEPAASFGPPVFSYTDEEGVADGFLAPCVIHRVKTTADRDGVDAGEHRYAGADLGTRVLVANRDRAIAGYYERHLYSRRALVFAASPAHAVALAAAFNDMFANRGDALTADLVVSGQSHAARRKLIDEHARAGSRLRVLVSVNILAAGYDNPAVEAILLCRPTRHKSLYLLMKGRGSRLPESAVAAGSGAKDRFVLVDFVGATSWESEVFEPSAASAGSAADDAAMVSGHDGAVDSLPTVEADVGIAEVQVTDPFASSDPVIRGLHSKLDAARQALERDRETHRRDEARLAALRHELDEEHRRLHAARREAFAQLVTGLHRFAPLVPISGDVLAPLTPWATDLAALNQLFGVERPSVQAHIDAVLAATPTASPVDRPTAV